MASAACADFLDTDHSIAGIANAFNMGFVVGLKETRPTRPGIKLRARFEERQTAEAAGVNSVSVIVEKYATERRFRAVLEQYASRVLIETCGDLRTLRLRWGPQVKVTHRDTSGWGRVLAVHVNRGIS
jgi:hypothetical protein